MTATFKTGAMKCGGCANNIRAVIGAQPGVRHVSADPFTKVVAVEFDEAATDAGAIGAALAAAGYPVDGAGVGAAGRKE